MTDVLTLSAAAHDAAVEETALMTKLDAARQRLAAAFASERVELVASVADTLLGPRRSAAFGPAAHFAFWTRRAALAKLAASCAARCRNMRWRDRAGLSFICRRRMSRRSFCIPGRSLISPATPIRAPAASSQRAHARHYRLLPQAAGGSRGRSQLLVHYPSQGDLGAKISARSDARVCLGRRRQGRLVRPPTCAIAASRSGSATASRFPRSTARRSTSWTRPPLGRCQETAQRVFVFDQMACSSPHALYVVGDAATHSAGVRRLLDASALEWTMDDPKAHVGPRSAR